MLEIYLWADGRKFDVDKFQVALPLAVRGTSEVRQGVKIGVNKYWKSEVRKTRSRNPDEELCRILEKYGPVLLGAREAGASRIFAEIVVNWQKLDEVGGFYFSDKSIRLLSDLGASLDIDVYERFSRGARYTLDYKIGDTVKLVKTPGWVESLSLETQKVFKSCVNRFYQIIDITLDGHLVLGARRSRNRSLGSEFNDIRVDPRYVVPSPSKPHAIN